MDKGSGKNLLIARGHLLTKTYQWWNRMQEVAQRVNRPHGWAFQGITNGEIKYMKLWQVSVGWHSPYYVVIESLRHSARSLEL